jgi:type I restriction enzyme M protein
MFFAELRNRGVTVGAIEAFGVPLFRLPTLSLSPHMSENNTNLNTTKEQERAELHRAIWQIATDLRGSVDGWDFKQYVLGILFYRFISENLTNYINADERRAGKKDFDYATLSDKEAEFGRADTVKEKGFYILPSGLFVNVRKNARNDANLNETLANVFTNIENSAKGSSSEDGW